MKNENDKKKNSSQKPIYVDRDIPKSKAYLSLNGTSAKMLLVFLGKRQMLHLGRGKKKEWICTNNGNIYFTYKEAKEKYNISHPAFSRAIEELVSKGFIDIARQGIGIAKIATLYSISDRWKKYGKKDFVEIKRQKQCSYRFNKYQK